MAYVWIILITLIAGVVGTGIGGFIGALFRRDSSKVVSLLLAFAAGVMLAVVCFDLLKTAVLPEEGHPVAWWIVVLTTLVGYLGVYFINRLVDNFRKRGFSNIYDDSHHLLSSSKEMSSAKIISGTLLSPQG